MPTDSDKIFEKLVEFHAEFTEFRGEMKVRVDHVEKELTNARLWENIKIFAVLPITAALHAAGLKLGLFSK